MRLASRLGPIALEDARTGAPRKLESLWSEGPALVVFLRHFG
ncbi:MAG: hypothetical protein AAGC67_21205 [Myxococcota bacterium]